MNPDTENCEVTTADQGNERVPVMAYLQLLRQSDSVRYKLANRRHAAVQVAEQQKRLGVEVRHILKAMIRRPSRSCSSCAGDQSTQ